MGQTQSLPAKQQLLQNYVVVWVDANFDESSEGCQSIVQQLRSVVDKVHAFRDPNASIRFLQAVTHERVFVITDGTLGEDLLPRIHFMAQVNTIYVLCNNPARHKPWTEQWSKIKDVFTRIEAICEGLRYSAEQCDRDLIPISYVLSSNTAALNYLDRLESSFIYAQLLKGIFLEMQFDRQTFKEVAKYARQKRSNLKDTKIIDEFEKRYRPGRAIWWYTRECFISQMFNRAFRLLDADIIFNIGFVVHDLHQQIEQLYRDQVSRYLGRPFTVYRGQGLSTTELDQLRKNEGGLLSFNSFLSTYENIDTALDFAMASYEKERILFVMTIDPVLNSTPFANISAISYTGRVAEILFSMLSVFRIVQVKSVDTKKRLHEVHLTLIADTDPQLRRPTRSLEQDLVKAKGWNRIGKLLIKMRQLETAEKLYKWLLEHSVTDGDRAYYNHLLGCIKSEQGENREALWYFEVALDINCRNLPANHPYIGSSNNNIGLVYVNMVDYAKAGSYFEKALAIYEKNIPVDQPSLATSYNNIAEMQRNTKQYSKALATHRQALAIRQRIFPSDHLSLATSWNNVGLVYSKMGDDENALFSHKRAFEIGQKALPACHPNLGMFCSNIGSVYYSKRWYSEALEHFQRGLDIFRLSLTDVHYSVQATFKWIEIVKRHFPVSQ